MNIKVESAGACRKQVHIEFPAEDVALEYDQVLSAYAQGVRIPGFRPGRVPRDLVKKRFSKEIVKEVKERLIPRGYQEALKRENIEAVAVLDVKEKAIEEGQPFSFILTLDVFPDFQMPEYKGIALDAKKPDITDADIDHTIDTIRDQNSKYEDVEGRPVQKGDMVKIDYEGVCEGQPIEQLAPGAKGLGTGTDFWMISDPEQAFLPGFGDGLLGANIGEKRQVTVDFPADFAETAVAGKKAIYVATTKALRAKKLVDMDEAFIKSMGFESQAALRDRVREDLRQMRESGEKRRLQNEIVKYLLEKTAFDVPDSVLQEETRNEVYDMVQQSTYRGASREDIEGRKDELIEAATRSAAEKVKVRYILRRVARQENISISEQDVADRVKALAGRHGMPADKLRADLEKKGALPKVAEEVRLGKTLAFLLDQAKINWS
ncbi:MAG: trigger factor [bacterium]